MTLEEYMSEARFPLTTQVGLTASQQLSLDSYNWDSLGEMIDNQEPLDEEQKQIFQELKEKRQHMAELVPLIAQQDRYTAKQGQKNMSRIGPSPFKR